MCSFSNEYITIAIINFFFFLSSTRLALVQHYHSEPKMHFFTFLNLQVQSDAFTGQSIGRRQHTRPAKCKQSTEEPRAVAAPHSPALIEAQMTHAAAPGEGRNQESIKQQCQSMDLSGCPCILLLLVGGRDSTCWLAN